MFNRNAILIILLAIALLAGIFVLYQDQIRRYDWDESSWTQRAYSEKSDQPYGVLAMYRLTQSLYPGSSFSEIQRSIHSELKVDSSGHSNYLFIGAAMYLDSVACAQLLQFVSAGNRAFISSKQTPASLLKALYGTGCNGIMPDLLDKMEASQVQFTLVEQETAGPFKLSYAIQNRPSLYNWHYFGAPFLCATPAVKVLGHLNDSLVNCLSFQYGKGSFVLHSNPIVFANYSMLQPGCREYVARLLGYLHPEHIIWDRASQIPAQENKEVANPLTYILKQKALAWAWYLLMVMSVLWIVFRGKRRQRIIPILAPNENSSYEFIRTIAHLHFKERNYRGQTELNMRLFLAQVRERYGFTVMFDPQFLLPKTDEAFFKRLAQVSEVPESKIKSIFVKYSNTRQYEPNEEMMVELHQEMEGFWKNAR
jgi:hypothetical protein